MLRIIFNLFLIIFSFQTFSQSDTLSRADDLRRQGDIKEAIRTYKRVPDEEKPIAHYILGMIYKNGDGVDVDYKKSYRYLKKSADKEFAPAQFELAVLHEQNLGVPQPKIRKRRRNQADIQFNSGVVFADPFFYRYHSPFYADPLYFRRGYINSPFFERNYYYGYPVIGNQSTVSSKPIEPTFSREPRTPQQILNREAFSLYFQSAMQWNLDALFNLGEIYNENRLGLFDTRNLETRRRDAIAFWKIAARKGHPLAQQRMGQAYMEGEIVERDPLEAYFWFALFANQDAELLEPVESADEPVFLIALQEQAEENLKLLGSQISSEELVDVTERISSHRNR